MTEKDPAASAAVPSTKPVDCDALAAALGLSIEDQLPVGSREAFVLGALQAPRLVLAGALELFLVPGEAADAGRRHHVCTLPAGSLCPQLTHPCEQLHLLAVPRQGTRVAELSRSILARAPADSGQAAALSEAVDTMLGALARADWLSRPPSQARALLAGPLTLAQGEKLATAHSRVLWLHSSADALLASGPRGVARQVPLWFPLCGHLWLHARADCTCEVVDSAELLTRATLETALSEFLNWLLALGPDALAMQEQQAGTRIRRSRAALERSVESSLWSLAAILGMRRRRLPTPSPEPMINLLWLVTDEFGIKRPNEDELRQALATDDPMLALAQRAGLFLRAVELEGDWWRDAQEPLFATLTGEGKPQLLLPGRWRRYDAIDPASGLRLGVDRELAARFDSKARVFYRPFPDGPLRAPAVLRFGLRGLRADVWLVVLLILLSGMLSLAMPTLSQRVFDPIIPLAATGQLLVVVLAILVAGWARNGFGLLQGLHLLRIEGRMTTSVQTAVWDRLLKLPARFFHDFAAGDLANRAMSVDAMRKVLSDTALSGITHGIIAVFSLGLLFYYDWRVTLAVLVAVLLYGAIAVYAGRKVVGKNREILKREGHLQGVVLRLLDGLTKLRVAGAEPAAFAHWGQLYAKLQQVSYDQQRLENILTVFKSGFSHFTMVAVILAISWQGHELLAFYETPATWGQLDSRQLQEIMPTARFVAFNVALGQFVGGAFGLISMLVRLSILPAYYERVEPILTTTTEQSEGAADPGDIQGEVAVEGVVFRYQPDGAVVLDGVSLHAAPHEMVAVVGPSGAGKSSLVRLILGFETPEAGSVFLDGKDIAGLNKHAMRRGFGVVLQNGMLLSGSIYQNIAGGAQLSRDQVMEAARLAGLADDIEALPMGLDTHLSEGATTFSGGQRQRLMIARALVHRPRVLIFDEATSALDNRSQQAVTEGLETLNSTRIVIAHRLSTIMHADRIYVLDRGRVVEHGDYQALLAAGGLFAAMARRQML
ncbi:MULTISPECIES: NHLP bacteriocin export ABC transporter permease/ATPase subunit [Thiorhodovibrio]|uniref:NHLP bacteriocin export ABC transporter permease/ATPase subunit n=1 Tax=Thiorhodovibrio TaxID=61593 RepID=UPI001913B62F|nr:MULTISPECIES: NHLP bacteriocin export ABC transporter permease/ATPase subunit [Thiorhodovibrio]MBK5969997.1 NHLP bacteriocin export ABC transporter permease/ATPase subunit [Thiorhodovibrio winogradskyi]WPL12919.1 Alpha-hemolysin translocation ATP-binding protein HlyB [Thiorhodovibrio litoralis]